MARKQVIQLIDRIFAVLYGLGAVGLGSITLMLFLSSFLTGIFGLLSAAGVGIGTLYYLYSAKTMWNLEQHRQGIFYWIFTILTGLSFFGNILGLIITAISKDFIGIAISIFGLLINSYLMARLLNILRG